jgi:hypothetical protein
MRQAVDTLSVQFACVLRRRGVCKRQKLCLFLKEIMHSSGNCQGYLNKHEAFARFQDFMAVTMILRHAALAMNRCFGGTYHLHHQGNNNLRARNNVSSSVLLLIVTANFVPSPPILVLLMMVAIRSSEMSILRRPTRFNIPKDAILHSHR